MTLSVISEIQNEIEQKGPITFARFMELALYSPNGYYEKQRDIGKKGDFYTSVSVGPLFGELLARQFATWLRASGATHLIEVGAHDGSLARDILNWLVANDAELFDKLRYTIVEPSADRCEWQQQTLSSFANRVDSRSHLPDSISGIIFSNELLDAMPMHRLRWNAQGRKWDEWFVGYENNQFVWQTSDLSAAGSAACPNVAPEFGEVLPDGFTTEVSPAAIKWWTDAATKLEHGKLVAIDYGLAEQEFFRPDRSNGTARGYFKHRLADDLLGNPGEQDLTAHVNWTAIQRAGEQVGLRTETFCSQEEFLMRIVQQTATESWNSEQIKQLKTLIHPNFLGRAFRVLVQERA